MYSDWDIEKKHIADQLRAMADDGPPIDDRNVLLDTVASLRRKIEASTDWQITMSKIEAKIIANAIEAVMDDYHAGHVRKYREIWG